MIKKIFMFPLVVGLFVLWIFAMILCKFTGREDKFVEAVREMEGV